MDLTSGTCIRLNETDGWQMGQEQWQYVQVSDALDEEFVAALSRIVRVTAWRPEMKTGDVFRRLRRDEVEETTEHAGLSVWRFPLQRGYARPAISWMMRSAERMMTRFARHSEEPAATPLVCSTPYYAPLAEIWPGPVVYYLTDLMKCYAGADGGQVRKLDRRMGAVATLVCPNSTRIADYLVEECGCNPNKIQVVPNATRSSSLLPTPLFAPEELPVDAAGLRRPVAGVIGNMGANLNWSLLLQLVEANAAFSWLMVGPVHDDVVDAADRAARASLLERGGRVRFVGRKPYGELAAYARSFDVAVLPYNRREPTFSGSSTRFYEHLAATRPILATRGFEELLHKPPLLRLFDTAEEGSAALRGLAACGFDDGQIEARWQASREGTWDRRAEMMHVALAERLVGAAV